MKLEHLHKLSLNKNYTDNEKLVLKHTFGNIFDKGLEHNKTETIRFIQSIVDEGFFKRRELYNEALNVRNLFFTAAIQDALFTLTGKAVYTNEKAKNMFMDYIIKVFPKAMSTLKKFKISKSNKIDMDKKTAEFLINQKSDLNYICIILFILFYDSCNPSQRAGVEMAVKEQVNLINSQLNNRSLDGEISLDFGEDFLKSKIYLRFLEKRTSEMLDYVSNHKSEKILDTLDKEPSFSNIEKLKEFSKKEQKLCNNKKPIFNVFEKTNQRFVNTCRILAAMNIDYSLTYCNLDKFRDFELELYPFLKPLLKFGLVQENRFEYINNKEGIIPLFKENNYYSYFKGYKGTRVTSAENFLAKGNEEFKTGNSGNNQKILFLGENISIVANCCELIIKTLQEYLLEKTESFKEKNETITKTDLISKTQMQPADIERVMAMLNKNIMLTALSNINANDYYTLFSSYDFSDITPFFDDNTVSLSDKMTKSTSSISEVKTDKKLNLNKKTKELETEKAKLSEELEEYRSQIEKLKQQNLSLKNKVEKYQNQENINTKLRKKLSEKDKEIDKSNNKITDLQEIINELQCNENTEQDTADFYIPDSYFKDKRILVIGGRWEIVDKLKELMPELKHTENANDSYISPDSYDYVLMFTDFMNHTLFYKYITRLRNHKKGKVPILYLQGSNLDNIKRNIYNFYQKLNSK